MYVHIIYFALTSQGGRFKNKTRKSLKEFAFRDSFTYNDVT